MNSNEEKEREDRLLWLNIMYGTPKWTRQAQDQEDARDKLLFQIEIAKIGYFNE